MDGILEEKSMNSAIILYPAFCMFALTLGSIFYLGIVRYRAIHRREVKISYFRTYNEGTQPKRLHVVARHVNNHFEVPPLFHIGVILAYVTGSSSLLGIVFAWLFVGARVIHTYIHLGGNNVSYRFFVYGFSLLCLGGLWISVFYKLVQ